jgi:UDP-N-acetylglucosamine acyltransferase
MPAKRETTIDPRAVVSDGAQLDIGVKIGPFSVVGENVRIGADTIIGPHAVLEGRTTIGKGNRIFQFASVGAMPQDLKYEGEDSELVIGDRNQIRECATIHRGTKGGGMVTRIGNDGLFMAYSHVAHDCILGNNVILGNAATLAGHILIENNVILSGLTGVHQFCRIGQLAYIGAAAMVVKDVPPYTTVQGDRAKLAGLNLEGLKRKGLDPEEVSNLKKAYRLLFRSGLILDHAVARVNAEVPGDPNVRNLIDFVQGSERGVTR